MTPTKEDKKRSRSAIGGSESAVLSTLQKRKKIAKKKALLSSSSSSSFATTTTTIKANQNSNSASTKFLRYLLYGMQVENDIVYSALENRLHLQRNDIDLEIRGGRSYSTPIVIAAQRSWLRTVCLLATVKADVNASNDWNKTALIYISSCKSPEHTNTAALLIKYKADVNKCDNWGRTALAIASIVNNLSMVQLLLINKADTEIRNNAGRTPLLETCLNPNGTLEMVQCLVNVGLSNVSGKDKYEQTPLQCATISGKLAIVQYLIHQQKCRRYNPFREEQKALICAVQYNHMKLVRYYIEERHVDVNCKDDEDYTTPLMTSVYIADIDMVKLLLQYKADTEARDIYGKSALDRALNGGIFGDNDTNVLQELVDARYTLLKTVLNEMEILGLDSNGETAKKIHGLILDYSTGG